MSQTTLDYKHPDYVTVYAERARRLAYIRAEVRKDAKFLGQLKRHYSLNVADFISDWGMTMDPRNAGTDIPVVMPFILFPRQRQFIEYIDQQWKAKAPGLCEKSRDMGISWLSMAWAVSRCLLGRSFVVGFGSAKEDKVDLSGDPSCLFYKGRMFLQNLPPEFRGEWNVSNKSHTAHMRILFPDTEGAITGEAGDNIGRGGRTAVYFVDEAAHIERPKLIDASLSATTDCRVDMSSVNGMANSFAEKRHSGKVEVFTFSWRDDPRRDDAWAAKKQAELDPVIWNAEYEINYQASTEGVIVPYEWVMSAVGLLEKLGLKPTGERRAALDVADRGMDKNAYAWRHGQELQGVKAWSGKGSDIYETVVKSFELCDELRFKKMLYDGDGLGAGVRGDARVINERRQEIDSMTRRPKQDKISVDQFRGSAAVLRPEDIVPYTDRKAIDFFANYKAQSWWSLRFRFQESHKAANGLPYNVDNIISIPRGLPDLTKICSEISQPVYKINLAGKILVDKQPDEAASPNLGDAVMMAFSPRDVAVNITQGLLDALSR